METFIIDVPVPSMGATVSELNVILIKVKPGDRIIYKTAGSGGWGDPFERDATIVARDVRYGLVSRQQAETGYGVILTADNQPDVAATTKLRDAMKARRGPAPQFDFGYTPPERQAAE